MTETFSYSLVIGAGNHAVGDSKVIADDITVKVYRSARFRGRGWWLKEGEGRKRLT